MQEDPRTVEPARPHEAQGRSREEETLEELLRAIGALRPAYAQVVSRTRARCARERRTAPLEQIRVIEAARKEAERLLARWWRGAIMERDVMAAFEDVRRRMRAFIEEARRDAPQVERSQDPPDRVAE